MAELRRPALALLAAAALLVVLTLQAPFTVAVFGVMLLGPLHVLLAVRYLGGRIADAVPASTAWLLVAFVAAMALVRAVATVAPHLGHQLELAGSTALVGFALMLGLRGRTRYPALLLLVLVAVASFAGLPWYWHLLTHAHNLVPLIFLWDWTRRHTAVRRLAFVGTNLIWLLGIPAAILLGLADPLLDAAQPGATAQLVAPELLIAGVAPPGADATVGLRFLAAFAFLQAMHYLLWMVFFQIAGRTEVRRFPLAGWRFWTLAAGLSALIWAAYATGYYNGRAVYGVLGAFNVHLEQPVATWLLLTALPVSATTPLIDRLRTT